MATTLSFEDRFSYPDPNGPAPGIDKATAAQLSDEELLSLSSELNDMVNMVRRYSVLTNRVGALDVFNIITTESDPQIALILSAAKSKVNNEPLFGGLAAIKEIMFADPNRPDNTNYTNRTLFADGIRRVSAALTASRIVGQFAQLTEQLQHSERIREDAIKDLDRIILTWDLNNTGSASAKKDEEEEVPSAFYFEPKTLVVPVEKTLVVEWQSPSLSADWDVVGRYSGEVETWQIVSDLSNAINSQGINNPDNVLLAAPELSGPYFTNRVNLTPTQYHALNFYPRRPLPGVMAYSINVRINVVLNEGQADASTVAFPIDRSPFIWGVTGDSLNNYIVNGSIIIIRYNKLTTVRSAAENYDPFVLYFRNNTAYGELTPPPTDSKLIYRIQPWLNLNNQQDVPEEEVTQTIEVDIPRLTSTDPEEQLALDNNRFSQVTLALTTSLTTIDIDTYLASAIIRNDPLTAASPMSAVELVPWARQRVIAAAVLDILYLPPDVDIATGDRARPITTFTNKPLSAMVKNPFANSNSLVVLKKENSLVSPRRRSSTWTAIKDEAKSVMRGGSW